MAPPSEASPDENDRSGAICFCGQDWWYHNRAHSDFQLMIRISKHQRVLLVNSIGMRMPVPGRTSKFLTKILRKLRSMTKLLRRPLPDHRDLFVMTPISVPIFGLPGLRLLAVWFVRAQVSLVAWWLGIRNPMICVTPPTAWGIVAPMRKRCLIYNRSDKHSAFKEANTAMIRELELALMQNADHVLYVNRELMAEDAPDCRDNAFFLDHGVDASWFDSGGDPEPSELVSIPHPRIGFFGGLRAHLVDMDLLARLADELPECQMVLVGDAASDIEDLIARDNVHWLGFRDHKNIPSFGAGFDVALLPYLTNDWIQHCNPIKLKEYLALGLPVVSSDFPEARRYAPHVRVASSHDEFIEMVGALAAAVTTPLDREAQRDAVRDSTWGRKADDLLRLTEGRLALGTAPVAASKE